MMIQPVRTSTRVRILLLNQSFYPDTAATAQYLADLAVGLAERSHDVRVLCSQVAYGDSSRRFSAFETWKGIRISRVFSPNFGKESKWRRALTFGLCLMGISFRLLFMPRIDVIVALTSPPLISVLAALVARLRGIHFVYWVMDLNPDEAVAARWLRSGGLLHRTLEEASRFSLRSADGVVVLDRFMRQRLLEKGVDDERVHVIPPWVQDQWVRFDADGRTAFRKLHGLEGKFVVMYSGNHSPCHPLDTVFKAARLLRTNYSIHFCFVGGGSEWAKIREAATSEGLPNISCLPYQPIALLAGSLSSADLHVIAVGDPFVGLIHPCKVYNILAVGCPLICIGPQENHVADIVQGLPDVDGAFLVRHGEADRLARHISAAADRDVARPVDRVRAIGEEYSREQLLDQLVQVVVGGPAL